LGNRDDKAVSRFRAAVHSSAWPLQKCALFVTHATAEAAFPQQLREGLNSYVRSRSSKVSSPLPSTLPSITSPPGVPYTHTSGLADATPNPYAVLRFPKSALQRPGYIRRRFSARETAASFRQETMLCRPRTVAPPIVSAVSGDLAGGGETARVVCAVSAGSIGRSWRVCRLRSRDCRSRHMSFLGASPTAGRSLIRSAPNPHISQFFVARAWRVLSGGCATGGGRLSGIDIP
jgi:hypothetical protein